MFLSFVALLFLFQIKHFIADYPLQNSYMLRKFAEKGWVLPLLSHAGVHAVITFAIAHIYSESTVIALGCAFFDLVVHFVMDRTLTKHLNLTQLFQK